MQKRYKPKQMIPIFFIAIMSMVFLVRYIPSIFAQFDSSTGRQYSTRIRMPLNIIAFRVMKANPVSGVGLGNYLENNHMYVREDETMVESWQIHQLKTDMVHNTFMLIGAETGFPGLFFFLWYLFMIYRTGRRNIKSKITYLSNLSIGMLTGYTAVLIAFLASPDYRIHQINVLVWLIGGLIHAINILDEKYNKIISLKKKEHLLKSEPALLKD